jgi:hypothetical protein
MIKIGDKVKIDKYIPYDYMTNRRLMKTIVNKDRIRGRDIQLIRTDRSTTYKTKFIEESLDGVFIGKFRKKLNRIYRIPTRQEEETLRHTHSMMDAMLMRVRPSKSVFRLDDPYKLDKMAMMRVGGKMIATSMGNIMKCNFADKFKII